MRSFRKAALGCAYVVATACGSETSGPQFSAEPLPSAVPSYKIAYTLSSPATVMIIESGKSNRTIAPPSGSFAGTPTRPVWSPSGDRLAFTTLTNSLQVLYAWDAQTGTLREVTSIIPNLACTKGQCSVLEPPFSPVWSSDGSKLAFFSKGSLKVATLDGSPIKVIASPPVSIQDNTLHWSPDENSLWFAAGASILSVPLSGATSFTTIAGPFGATATPETIRGFELSPDRKQIAATADANLYLVDVASKASFAVKGGSFFPPAWSPDGTTIAVHLSPNIYVLKSNGTSLRRVTAEGNFSRIAWLADGKNIAFMASQIRGVAFANIEGGAVQLLGSAGPGSPTDFAVAWK